MTSSGCPTRTRSSAASTTIADRMATHRQRGERKRPSGKSSGTPTITSTSDGMKSTVARSPKKIANGSGVGACNADRQPGPLVPTITANPQAGDQQDRADRVAGNPRRQEGTDAAECQRNRGVRDQREDRLLNGHEARDRDHQREPENAPGHDGPNEVTARRGSRNCHVTMLPGGRSDIVTTPRVLIRKEPRARAATP